MDKIFWEEVRENRRRLESTIPQVLRNTVLHDCLYDGATKCQPLYLVTSGEGLVALSSPVLKADIM